MQATAFRSTAVALIVIWTAVAISPLSAEEVISTDMPACNTSVCCFANGTETGSKWRTEFWGSSNCSCFNVSCNETHDGCGEQGCTMNFTEKDCDGSSNLCGSIHFSEVECDFLSGSCNDVNFVEDTGCTSGICNNVVFSEDDITCATCENVQFTELDP